MRRIEALLALAAITNAQGVPRPTRLRIYEVRTSLRFDEGELQRVNFRYDRSSGIKSDIARSLVDVGLTTDRGFVFEVAFFGTEDPGQVKAIRPHRGRRDFVADDPEPGGRDPLPRAGAVSTIARAFSFRPLQQRGDSPAPSCSCSNHYSYYEIPPQPP